MYGPASPRPRTGWIFALGGFLAGITAVGVLMFNLGAKQPKAASDASIRTRSMAPSSNVARERSTTFGQLQESYDANQSAAIDWLKKGPITFVGKIDMIVANGHKDVLVVTFSSGDADGIHVAFYYREQFRAQVDSLYSGEDVRLTGSFMFKGDLDSLNFEGTGIEAFGDAAS